MSQCKAIKRDGKQCKNRSKYALPGTTEILFCGTHKEYKGQKSPKKNIRKTLRHAVWDEYIGKDKRKGPCFCCGYTLTLERPDWDCGHFISEFNGGPTTLSNLRPICKKCNSDMRTENMDDYMRGQKNFGILPSETKSEGKDVKVADDAVERKNIELVEKHIIFDEIKDSTKRLYATMIYKNFYTRLLFWKILRMGSFPYIYVRTEKRGQVDYMKIGNFDFRISEDGNEIVNKLPSYINDETIQEYVSDIVPLDVLGNIQDYKKFLSSSEL